MPLDDSAQSDGCDDGGDCNGGEEERGQYCGVDQSEDDVHGGFVVTVKAAQHSGIDLRLLGDTRVVSDVWVGDEICFPATS